ncbi:endonuclease/exonuclease/phosphatase family protein [Terrisporobacter vanillatitrophus]|uniref:endonuclease/exonuclease/phosphatase family protein n=1 Tax=Terrisporobacter vanillatitrophus TaxID=3058402 RepID=UPI0033673766
MKLICYNIHKGMDEFRRITLFQLIGYLKSLDCDVICIQEVLYYQFKLMKILLNMDGVFGLHVNNRKMKFGICILSKNKINYSSHILLSSKTEQRGLLSIDIDDKIIINTHLGLDIEERQTQISEILDFAKSQKKDIVICGDFNEKNISLGSYKDVAQYLCKDFYPTFKTSRIDYVFISSIVDIKCYEIDQVFYSDHFPIIVKI